MGNHRIAVLGAGLAGMAAAATLKDQDVQVYEARRHPGGHASSFECNGFTFDEGPHVSFTPHERIRDFFARSVDGRFLEHPSTAVNYYKGTIVKHPVQCNLRNLPPALISASIADFVRAQYEDNREIRSYADWCYKQLGKTISEEFTRLYTRKYWTLELEQLTTDWVSQRIYAPRLEDVLDGALLEAKGQHYYMSTFRYPERGGFQGYTRLLASLCPVRPGMRVVEIDPRKKKLVFENGIVEHFDFLISSLPLPELIGCMTGVPAAIREAAGKLVCSSHFLVSLGIKRPEFSDYSWTYFYDEDIPFSRLSFPYKYSPYAAPPGHSSVQAEVVHSRFRPLPAREALVDQCIDSLLKCGMLHSRSEIVACDARDIRYANVIFDFERVPNLRAVHGYLAGQGIQWCGRYGDWEYLWTDQAILSGERAGNEVRRALDLPQGNFEMALTSGAVADSHE